MVSLIDIWNKVTTALKAVLKNKYPTIFITSSLKNSLPTSLPCVSIRQLGNEMAAKDLQNKENAVISTIEIKTFSDVDLNVAREMMGISSDEMLKFGYERIYGPEEMDISLTIFCMVSRFRRLVGGGETI